jgi:predicted GH43/DUF377 family glycosyl hydrolase
VIAATSMGLLDAAFHAFSVGELAAGHFACEQLMSLDGVPAHIRQKARHAQARHAWRISHLIPGTQLQPVTFPTPVGWSRFNPSITPDESGYRMIVRSSNYAMDRLGYVVHDEDGIVRTTNYLLLLDEDLTIRSITSIDDQTDRSSRFPGRVTGFEDCRLVQHCGQWHATATTFEYNSGGIAQIALLDLDEAMFKRVRLLSDPATGRHEKNWMPLTDRHNMHFVYSCYPTVVLRLDEDGARVREVVRHGGPVLMAELRGGSQVIEIDDGALCLVHDSVGFDGTKRLYPHRFVLFDRDLILTRISPPFFFRDRTLEFCSGLACRDGWLTASYGVDDREAWLARMRLDEVLGLLRPR